jgi:hypothetical protein
MEEMEDKDAVVVEQMSISTSTKLSDHLALANGLVTLACDVDSSVLLTSSLHFLPDSPATVAIDAGARCDQVLPLLQLLHRTASGMCLKISGETNK